ncbi:MAG: EAL domain-containing protein [Betaproteobacteria bacterium]|nr:EAL domain-containing protein [Betaproteobacteria bacterium]
MHDAVRGDLRSILKQAAGLAGYATEDLLAWLVTSTDGRCQVLALHGDFSVDAPGLAGAGQTALPDAVSQRNMLDAWLTEHGYGLCRIEPVRAGDGSVLGQLVLGLRPEASVAGVQSDWVESLARLLALRVEQHRQHQLTSDLVTAFAAISEGVLMTDARQHIFYVNPAFTRITGYSLDEVRGRNCNLLQGADSSQEVRDRIRTALEHELPFFGEILNYRKDGMPFWNELTIQPVRTERGEIRHFVGVIRDVSQRKARELMVEHLMLHDPLTDLPNRRALGDVLARAMERSHVQERLLAVAVLDLDGFKPVNDAFGHDAGDTVLKTVSNRFRGSLRAGDFAARLGGDEFVLLFSDLEHLDQLEAALARVQDGLEQPISLDDGVVVSISCSIGVCIYPFIDVSSPDGLLRLADQALYEAKSVKAVRERNWVLFGEEHWRSRNDRILRLFTEDHLVVHYQPILNVDTGKIVGVEALARLRDDAGDLLYPSEFLSRLDAAQTTELSRMVLTQSLADLARLDALGSRLWVSFNIAPESFCGNCVPCLEGVIRASGIDPSRVTVEVLEGSDFLERTSALAIFHEIRKLGIRVALDDVGSAYASLLRMKELPIDEIKLDQGFVRTLEHNPQDLHFVRAIQDLAEELSVDLVVEGVETLPILDAMQGMGVAFVQGYAISRPVPIERLVELLAGQPGRGARVAEGFFGLYAKTLIAHQAIKKMARVNLDRLHLETLENPRVCQMHRAMQRLGCAEPDELFALHDEYHHCLGRVLRSIDATAMTSGQWQQVEQAMQRFLDALMIAHAARKADAA